MKFSSLVSFFIIGLLASTAAAQVNTPQYKAKEKALADIHAVIDKQCDAWNKGDIEGYMDGYDRTEDTTFISGDTVVRGWNTVLERYKKGFDTPEKMGQLTFSDLEMTLLSKDTAVVIGSWSLKRANDQPHGKFSLIFKKTKAGWRIILDHTSSV
ncbi:MAG TPA: DUF4440 domain-containing protein [Pyrinomonadaceae bacterium]